MNAVIEAQRTLYDSVWTTSTEYGQNSPGENNIAMFLSMAGDRLVPGQLVLDAGTGSGKGALALAKAGFRVAMCDLTDSGLCDEAKAIGPCWLVSLWHDLRPVVYLDRVARQDESERARFDWVYCCDVLEHIPTEYTMLTITRLLEVTRLGVFLAISLVPDNFGVWVGESLHRTVQPFTWWRDRLGDLGELVECRDCMTFGVYLVRPTR